MFCVVCHGAGGDGRGPVVLRGMLPPPSMHAGARASRWRTARCSTSSRRGQGNMASYAAQLTERERWEVIAHVRAMQEAQ